MLLLVPADPLRPRRPDEHFAPEAEAARGLGFEVSLIDHDALVRGEPDRAVRAVTGPATAVYRGWMVRAEQYSRLADALRERGVRPRVDPTRYRQAHELPGWYAAMAEVTPRSVWTTGTDRDDFDRQRARLGPGPAVLRDYTKSMKHYWHEAAYIPDLSDGPAAWRVASRFLELRGDDLTGGLVLRRFERLAPEETRSWWVDGICVLVTAHPDTAGTASGPDRPPTPGELSALAPLVAGLDLPFVTVDLARRDDGALRVVEVGDGQVSDRPRDTAPDLLLAPLRGLDG